MKTKAAVLNRLNAPLSIEKVEIPPVKKGQALVRILASGICRAQYNEMKGWKGPDKFLPHLLGHEASGVVEQVGTGVTKVRKGEYVACSWIKGRGREGGPSRVRGNGRDINAGSITTFSTYALIAENRLVGLSADIPPDIAAILGCAVATGGGIVRRTLRVKKGSTLAIFGIGGVGASAVLAARMRGCHIIIAVDVNQKKMEFARSIGATHTVDASGGKHQVLERIRQIIPSGPEYALDASGSRDAMETAFESLAETGMLAIAGNLKKGEKIRLAPFDLIRGKRIRGTWGGETRPDTDLPEYAEEYLKGNMPVDRLITKKFSLEQINEAFAMFESNETIGRMVIDMQG